MPGRNALFFFDDVAPTASPLCFSFFSPLELLKDHSRRNYRPLCEVRSTNMLHEATLLYSLPFSLPQGWDASIDEPHMVKEGQALPCCDSEAQDFVSLEAP